MFFPLTKPNILRNISDTQWWILAQAIITAQITQAVRTALAIQAVGTTQTIQEKRTAKRTPATRTAQTKQAKRTVTNYENKQALMNKYKFTCAMHLNMSIAYKCVTAVGISGNVYHFLYTGIWAKGNRVIYVQSLEGNMI